MQIPQQSVAGSWRSALFLAGLCLAGCLERNNPFDPLNQSSTLIHEILIHPDSLSEATKAAQAGDTLFLGPGTFPVELRFSSGSLGNPIVIRGSPGGKTILRPRDAGGAQAGIISNSHLRFEDIVFRGGSTCGIKVEGGSRDLAFERCVFDSNGTWGLDAAGSDISMKDCEIRVNGIGMRLAMDNCFDCQILLDNVLVVRNRGIGIEAVGINGSIRNSTIADNGAEGLKITNLSRSLNIIHSIFSGNGLYGLTRDATNNLQLGLYVVATDFWANGETGDRHWKLESVDSSQARILMNGNLNLDPGFADPPNFDYDPRPGSPPLSESVIIGYRRKL